MLSPAARPISLHPHLLSLRVSFQEVGEKTEKIEYRVWNPFRSKLAAAVLAGVDNIHIKPGAKVGGWRQLRGGWC